MSRLNEIWDSVRGFARARFALRGVRHGARVRCYGRVHVEGGRGITVGARVLFSGGIFPTELRCREGATLTIGASSMFNYGVSIVASESIRIGERCMFGSLVHIRDDDGRRRGTVTIGDDVWIAHGAIVEPGSTIGNGSVVAAGAVVVGDVPPRMLAIGNPAHCVPLESADSAVVQAQASARVFDPESAPVSARREAIASHAEPAPITMPAGHASKASSPTSTSIETTTSEPESIGPVSIAPRFEGATFRHSRAEVRTAIIDWLDDTRHFGEAESLIPNDSVSLRDGGLLDSLGLVQLVLMLEKRFDVTIDRELLARPGSQSMRAFLDLVSGAENQP